MKRLPAAQRHGAGELSPRVRAGASLKRRRRWATATRWRPFPPRSCGGLIEASHYACGLRPAAAFPPRSCGGLIEAAAPWEACAWRARLSPRVRAGASLKHPRGRGGGRLPRPFPPRSCGGLIEASVRLDLVRRKHPFPPRSCGGLIEAPRPPRPPVAVASLSPRIRAGASLKHKTGKLTGGTAAILSPRVRAGASLKQAEDEAHLQQLLPFPPRSCGGLIEAADRQQRDLRRAAFPPRSCGGLIEAVPVEASHAQRQRFPPAFVRGPH